jgi:hypothetical protein
MGVSTGSGSTQPASFAQLCAGRDGSLWTLTGDRTVFFKPPVVSGDLGWSQIATSGPVSLCWNGDTILGLGGGNVMTLSSLGWSAIANPPTGASSVAMTTDRYLIAAVGADVYMLDSAT